MKSLTTLVILSLCLPFFHFVQGQVWAQAGNHVLSLDGDGDYVEIKDSESLNAINSQVTMEAWIKPTSFPNQWITIIYKGDERTPNQSNRSFALWLNNSGFIQLNSAPEGQGLVYLDSSSGLIKLNRWYHFAGVIDAVNGMMRIFINGAEVANRDFPTTKIHTSKLPLRIGWTHEEKEVSHGAFAGQIDEVRIWNVARTQEEIKRTIYTTLSGKEPGLVGYWGFEGAGNIVADSSPNRSDGELIGDAHLMEMELPSPSELDTPTVISGVVQDDSGKPVPYAWVQLEKNGEEVANTQIDKSGKYRIAVLLAVSGLYDLSATARMEDMGNWQLGISLHQGESKTVNFTLTSAVSIEGTILMFDDKTPHVSVCVQAIQDGKVIDSMYTDEGGKYQFVNLKPGKYKVRCYIPGEYVYYKRKEEKGTETEAEILQVTAEKTVSNIDFRLPAFKKGRWKHYDTSDGLPGMAIGTIYQDYDGSLWFGTGSWNTSGYGVSHFDGKTFTNFTTEDGLGDNSVNAIYRDRDGVMWFGTGDLYTQQGGGVSKYDGKTFVNLTTEDGLAHNSVSSIYQDGDGVMWFGTSGGVSRYDGDKFINFTTRDGLAGNIVYTIYGEPDRVLWFGTDGGVSRYAKSNGRLRLTDGEGRFVNFTTEDGLAHNIVTAIHRTPDGMMWFGTGTTWDKGGGVSRYDGNQFVNFTPKDGLLNNSFSPKNSVMAIYSDANGVMWFGTVLGVSRYDGKGFVSFATKYYVEAIHQGSDGTFWFGTGLGGVSRYDETAFVTFNTKDGLMDDFVQDSHRDMDGILWITTLGGVSRYANSNGRLRLTDGNHFKNFTYKDGLLPGNYSAIYQAADGNLWFGTGGFIVTGSGISRYDGNQFVNFTTQEGLPHNRIFDINSGYDGTIWIGTAGGISRYDDKEFKNLTTEDGLANNIVFSIYSDPNGTMWFGIYGGVSCYDGEQFVNFTTADGLAHNTVRGGIHRDLDGFLWIGTHGGVSRYDGEQFVNFTQKDGLAGNQVYALHQDGDGILWFGTYGGGVSGYDGKAWTTLDTQYGLTDNRVHSIDPDPDGSLWFSTEKGLTRYRRSNNPPGIHIVSVKIADEEHTELEAIPAVIIGHRVTFKYNAIDFKTLPERRQYRCRIKEIDTGWRKPTKSDLFDFTFKKPGTYTFEVQAIDRDLKYSESATLTLQVKRPWWVFALFVTIGISIPLIAIGFYFGKRLQTQRAIAQQFNPYIAGRVVGSDLFYGRSDILTDIERTLANNCFLLYGERRIGKTSMQHQLRERLSKADDPTYRFIPAYIDLQGVAEEDFFRTIAASIVEHAASLFREQLALRLNEDRDRYTYRDLNRDLRTILDHLKENETRTIKLVLLMDEVDTLNSYSLRTNLNLRGLFMGPLKENLVLVMSGLYLKTDWSDEGAGSPPFNFLSREIQLEPLNQEDARKLITEPVKGFYNYESEAVALILSLSELRPFTIQAFCLRAVNRILADERTKIVATDIEAIRESVLAEVQSIRGERAGTSLPASLNEALSRIADLEAENKRLRDEAV